MLNPELDGDEGVGQIDVVGKATEEKLGNLHGVLAEYLTLRLRTGKASPAELGVAVTFLKNNSITASPATNEALDNLSMALKKRNRGGAVTAAGMRDAKEAFQAFSASIDPALQ